MYTIKQIEDAILTAIDSLSGSLGVKTIKVYEGQIETGEFLQTIEPVPIIYLVYAGSNYIDKDARQIREMTFVLFCIDKSLGNRHKAGIGDNTNPGTHAMLDGIRTALLNKRLSLTIFPFSLISEDIIGFVQGYAIYSATYKTKEAFLAPLS